MVSEMLVSDINDTLRAIELHGKDMPAQLRGRELGLMKLSSRGYREHGLSMYRTVSVNLRRDGTELVQEHNIDLLVKKGAKVALDVTISNGTFVAVYGYEMPSEVQQKLRALSALRRR